MADTDDDNIHGSLLIKLKTTVEGLLAGHSAQGVWSTFGGLKRVCLDTEAILGHGIKGNQASSDSDGGYWKFVQGLKWLCPSMATIIDKLTKRRSQGLTVAQSGQEWLQESVHEHSFIRQLDVLIGHKEHLHNFYHSDAFICQAHYVEAMRICFKAIELNKPALLSDINPRLIKKPKRSAEQQPPATTLTTSLAQRALRLGSSRLTPDGQTPRIPLRQNPRSNSTGGIMGSKHSHLLEVNYPNLNGSTLSLTVDPSIGFGVSSTRPHKSLSEPQTICTGLSNEETEWSSDHTSIYTSCTASSYETTAILPWDDDLERNGRLSEVEKDGSKSRGSGSGSGSGASGSQPNLASLSACSPDSAGLPVYDDIINVETTSGGDSKECNVIIAHKEDNSGLDSRLVSPNADDDDFEEYKQNIAGGRDGGGGGGDSGNISGALKQKPDSQTVCESDNHNDDSDIAVRNNNITTDSQCRLSSTSSDSIGAGISSNTCLNNDNNSTSIYSSQNQSDTASCDTLGPYDNNDNGKDDDNQNKHNAQYHSTSDGVSAHAHDAQSLPSAVSDSNVSVSVSSSSSSSTLPHPLRSSEVQVQYPPAAAAVARTKAGLVKSFSVDAAVPPPSSFSSSLSSSTSFQSANVNNDSSSNPLGVSGDSSLINANRNQMTTTTTTHSNVKSNQQNHHANITRDNSGSSKQPKTLVRVSSLIMTPQPSGSDPLASQPSPPSPFPHHHPSPNNSNNNDNDDDDKLEERDNITPRLSSSAHSTGAIYIPPSFQNRGGSLERAMLPLTTSDPQGGPPAQHKLGHKRWVSDTSAIQVQRSSLKAAAAIPPSSFAADATTAATASSSSSGHDTAATAAAAATHRSHKLGPPSYHGTLTRPLEGQSLISYLISQDFNTCANMEKENAHFHISEALIAAFESMEWNRTVRKGDTDKPHTSSSASSSDEEIQELRQRIRIRKREKMMQRGGRSFPSVSDDTQDGPGEGLSPPGTGTPHGSGSEEGDENGELDFKLSTETADPSGNESGATKNLRDLVSKGLNLSMASLYSETELQRSNQQAQQRSISQEESSLTAGSAESVAISLLKKFSEKHLPKASELKWLVSERDAPQRLLPLPASIPVSPDDADNQDLIQSLNQTRLRGNMEWAPPRAQIIFSIHPSEKRTAVLTRQNYRCAGCGTRVDPAFVKRYRYCEYLGKYFCQCCHSAETSIIPGRVIERWDFTRYPISIFSLRLLEKMWWEPLFHIDNINPGLYRRVRALEAIRVGRQQLKHLHALLVVCKRDAKLNKEFQRLPSHWIESNNVYSMDDFTQVRNGQMQTTIKSLVSAARQHVTDCQLCQGLGFICGLCKDTRVIFPFQLQSVVRCTVCQSCYHKACFVSDECPKCQRMAARRKQQQEAVSPQSPDSGSRDWESPEEDNPDIITQTTTTTTHVDDNKERASTN